VVERVKNSKLDFRESVLPQRAMNTLVNAGAGSVKLDKHVQRKAL
jgi:hypothetical protein